MTWVKISPDPPDYRNWLKCDSCGWLALLTQESVYACKPGEACKYCSTPLRPATAEDMKAAYPDGQFEWSPELSAVYVPVHFRVEDKFVDLPKGDESVLVWIRQVQFPFIASWDPDTDQGSEVFYADDHRIFLKDIIAWAPLEALDEHVRSVAR